MDGFTMFTNQFWFRLFINTVSMIILIRVIYYHTYHKRDLFFTFFLLNFVVFLLAYLLEKAKAFNSLGSAFGLLAAFSLLRFRTESISTKDMTYLFVIMAFGIINSIIQGSYLEILVVNFMIIGAVYLVDGGQVMRNQKMRTIEYEGVDNIQPDRQPELINDLRQRTGLNIQKISIEHIDFGRKKVLIKIYYY